jgi:hypothetical protein
VKVEFLLYVLQAPQAEEAGLLAPSVGLVDPAGLSSSLVILYGGIHRCLVFITGSGPPAAPAETTSALGSLPSAQGFVVKLLLGRTGEPGDITHGTSPF